MAYFEVVIHSFGESWKKFGRRPVETEGGGGAGGLKPSYIFTIVDLLSNDNDGEKKKSIVETYKPFQIPPILLLTLLLSTTCNA